MDRHTKRLNGNTTRISTTRTGVSAIPSAPANTDISLRKMLDAMRQSIQVIQAQGRGDPLDSAVTFRDIDPATGRVTSAYLQRVSAATGVEVANVSRPTVPSGVTVAEGMGYLIISWDLPSYEGHAHTSIFVEPVVAEQVPSLDDVYYRATTPGAILDVAVPNGDYWVWVKHTNVSSVVSTASTVVNATSHPYASAVIDTALADALATFERAQQDGYLVDVDHGVNIINNGADIFTIDRQWGQKVSIDDVQGGIGIWGDYDPDTGLGEINFAVIADNFFVFAPGRGVEAPTPLLVVQDNAIFMNNAYISTAFIDTLIADKVTASYISTIDLDAVNITGGNITIGQNFSVDEQGDLIAKNADVTGDITANSLTLNGAIPAAIDNSLVDTALFKWSGATALGSQHKIDAPLIWSYTGDIAGKAVISVKANDFEGAVWVGVNSTVQNNVMSGANNETKWYHFTVDVIEGTNYIRLWGGGADYGTVYELKLTLMGVDTDAGASNDKWDALNADTSPVSGAAIQIKSDTYIAGVQGWAIDTNGNVEFDSGKFRGTIYAPNIEGDVVGTKMYSVAYTAGRSVAVGSVFTLVTSHIPKSIHKRLLTVAIKMWVSGASSTAYGQADGYMRIKVDGIVWWQGSIETFLYPASSYFYLEKPLHTPVKLIAANTSHTVVVEYVCNSFSEAGPGSPVNPVIAYGGYDEGVVVQVHPESTELY